MYLVRSIDEIINTSINNIILRFNFEDKKRRKYQKRVRNRQALFLKMKGR
ncbi:hypothetical protein [Clostridium sp. LP20]